MNFFGQKLRELRERKKLSQEGLAQLVGYQRTNLANIEAGRKKASDGLIIKLAKALEVDPFTFQAWKAIDDYGVETLKQAFFELYSDPQQAIQEIKARLPAIKAKQEMLSRDDKSNEPAFLSSESRHTNSRV